MLRRHGISVLKLLHQKSKMMHLAENPATWMKVVEKALLGDTLQKTVNNNYKTPDSHEKKRFARKLISNPNMVTKDRLLRDRPHRMRRKVDQSVYKQSIKFLKGSVVEFFEDDQNSRLCGGKKEWSVKDGVKNQRRYLSDSMKNLHREFLISQTFTISYALFCRLRPFWIVVLKGGDRETCLGVRHCNIQLKVTALGTAGIFLFSTNQDLLSHMYCSRYKEQCLSRLCQDC